MARHKSTTSKIQGDPILFAKLCEEIYHIGPVVLGNMGLVSRTTIFDYSKGKSVTGEAEQAIIDSIARWNKQQETAADGRAEQARELLSA